MKIQEESKHWTIVHILVSFLLVFLIFMGEVSYVPVSPRKEWESPLFWDEPWDPEVTKVVIVSETSMFTIRTCNLIGGQRFQRKISQWILHTHRDFGVRISESRLVTPVLPLGVSSSSWTPCNYSPSRSRALLVMNNNCVIGTSRGTVKIIRWLDRVVESILSRLLSPF